ncbi:hypothetical protein Q604_UNBC06455G0001, partial [human gut metagenome]
TFKEAELTFVCKKLYEHQFDEAHLADNVKEYYAANPSMYTQVGKDCWMNVHCHRGYIATIRAPYVAHTAPTNR